jgi:methylglutaconyl-CoA hydratase
MVGFDFDENLKDSQKLADMFKIINQCPKPVVGRINGSAFGGGVGLVAVCDVAIAVENATFSFSEVKLGIIPSVVSPYVLARIGPGHARNLFITGDIIVASTALKIGLINDISTAEDLDKAVNGVVQLLLSNGPKAMQEVKLLVSNWLDMNEANFRNYTVEKIADLRTSPEGKEGLSAFLEKRDPKWRRE